MKKYLIVLLFFALTVLNGCSKWAGDPITEKFSIDGSYTELQVEDAFDVIVCDTVSQVVVTAGENVMPNVVVKEKDGKLMIYLKGWSTNHGAEMKVLLPYNADLVKVDLSGASDFHSEHALRGQKVEVELSGASDFYGDIEADEVELDLSGASNFNGNVVASEIDLDMSGSSDAAIIGQTGKLNLDLSGSSSILKKIEGNRYALVCDECEGSLSGSSDAFIHCDDFIMVNLSGSSDLHYTGNARTSGSNTSGSSDLIHDVL